MYYAWYPDGWWKQENREYLDGCSDEFLSDFLLKSRAHVLHILPEADDRNAITISGMVKD